LGTDAAQLLALCREAKVVVVHDVPSSRLPFEMLTTVAPAARPAVHAGISRRLAVKGVPVERLFSKPPKAGTLHVLLIVDPTEDLEGTVAEANAVRTILEQHKNRVELKVLTGNEAMKQAVLQALSSADILHYCGHAFFDGPGADQSGLILAGQDLLTLEDLEGMDTLPSVAFVNACESGRVRGPVTTEAAAFAELFLRSGVEAYVGTYWRVGDSAAANFATGVYTRLAEGQTLEAAVTQAREALLNAHVPDWANYILYGDGHFRLVVS
jgi:CHAT domain-containing protein